MELFDHVKIKSSGVTGVVVDVSDGKFIVESDEERKPDDTSGYPGRWPLYTCKLCEIELIK